MESLVEAYPREAPTILHRQRDLVEAAGENPCLLYGENGLELNYRQFDQLTNRLARSLVSHDLLPGQRVTLYSDNALLAMLVMFAAWKAGAVYCPVNTQLPQEMLVFALGDLGADHLVCDYRSLGRLEKAFAAGVPRPRVFVGDDPGLSGFGGQVSRAEEAALPGKVVPLQCFTGGDSSPLPITVSPLSIASIIYTSGTTGQPKGVVQRHAWLHALCATQVVWTHPEDIIHCDLPMYHIGGAFSLAVRGIWAGAKVALWDRFSATQYWDRIRRSGASIALLIDVMADWLLANPQGDDERCNSLSKVHVQPLPGRHRELAERFGLDYLVTGYGSSEVGNALIGFIDEFNAGQGTPEGLWKGYSKRQIRERLCRHYGSDVYLYSSEVTAPGFMGVPSGFYDIQLFDPDSADGIEQSEGRIVLCPRLDEVLFSGYLNHSGSGSSEIREGRYFSPDLARRDERGLYYFCGRSEGLLRVRGENVSAAAIEQVLEKHPAVVHSVVVGLPSSLGGEDDIAGFVQLKPGHEVPEAELRQWCEARLPAYMVPRALFPVHEMALTGSMKIDRGALRSQAIAALSGDAN